MTRALAGLDDHLVVVEEYPHGDPLRAQINRIGLSVQEVFSAKSVEAAQEELLRCGQLILLSYRFAHSHGRDPSELTDLLVALLREQHSGDLDIDRWIITSIFNSIRDAQYILQGPRKRKTP